MRIDLLAMPKVLLDISHLPGFSEAALLQNLFMLGRPVTEFRLHLPEGATYWAITFQFFRTFLGGFVHCAKLNLNRNFE